MIFTSIKQEDIEILRVIFAKPAEVNGELVWVTPDWLIALEQASKGQS